MINQDRFFYPSDFIRRVKEEYPQWEPLHNSLEEGRAAVGQHLEVMKIDNMPVSHVLEMLKNGKQAELIAEAEQIVRRNNLYWEWRSMAYPF